MNVDEKVWNTNHQQAAVFYVAPVFTNNSVMLYLVPQQPVVPNLCRDVLEQYCMCFDNTVDRKDSLESNQIEPLSDTEPSRVAKQVLCKKRILHTQNLDAECDTLEQLCGQLNHNETVLNGKQKSFRSTRIGPERSRFIGVSKNGPNWQALISINKRKTYIGSFCSELEAAKAFDKYSILMNNLTAKTNFSYNKTE